VNCLLNTPKLESGFLLKSSSGQYFRTFQRSSVTTEGDPFIKAMELVVDPNYGLIGFRGVIEADID
jgi:hypothetical protein